MAGSLKIFSPDGAFVRTVAAPVPPGAVIFGRFGTSAWAGIFFGGEFPPARTEMFREIFHVARYDSDLGSVDTLLALGANSFYGDRNGWVSVPGGPRGHFALHSGIVVAGDSETYELKVFGSGGELRQIIRNSMPNPVEARLIASARSRSRPAGATEEGGPRRRKQGILRARALFPPRFRPTEITTSRVLGVWKDELGVESIRVFRLIRS